MPERVKQAASGSDRDSWRADRIGNTHTNSNRDSNNDRIGRMDRMNNLKREQLENTTSSRGERLER